ncbi:uncharacterized protein LOC129598684 isoform X2 [Paramacrobiotus metropolitanus]|uniref:uncharacterized protein LOC129598684 isoform X2 n=1 Tax=Paramacrobiotus metropolitanus TaxID=2943436 RepID=UPI0024457498|nr:uncharacterized protein LOC129598684 isoform X2 [Paramacrobiotus metropolitanus]
MNIKKGAYCGLLLLLTIEAVIGGHPSAPVSRNRWKRNLNYGAARPSSCSPINLSCPRMADVPECPTPTPPTACLAPPACKDVSCTACTPCRNCTCTACTKCPDCKCDIAIDILETLLLQYTYEDSWIFEVIIKILLGGIKFPGRKKRSAEDIFSISNFSSPITRHDRKQAGTSHKDRIQPYYMEPVSSRNSCAGDYLVSDGVTYCIIAATSAAGANTEAALKNPVLMISSLDKPFGQLVYGRAY